MDDASIPTTDQVRREAVARAAIATFRRQRERAFRRNLTIAGVVLVPLVLALAWVLLVGYQRHVLEIRAGNAVVRLVSRRGPFEILVPLRGDPEFVPGGFGAYLRQQVEGPSVNPVSYDWASVAITEQTVEVPPLTELEFSVNGMAFTLVGQELGCEERRWLLVPGKRIEINLDVLPRLTTPAAR